MQPGNSGRRLSLPAEPGLDPRALPRKAEHVQNAKYHKPPPEQEIGEQGDE